MNAEKILSITETSFKVKLIEGSIKNTRCKGFEIVTNQQTILVGISEEQQCCESFGYLITNDNINDFIGARLKDISIVDKALKNKKIPELKNLGFGDAMFVNFHTSEGVLQFVAYNEQNGSYGHDAVIFSSQLNLKKII